MLLYQYMNVMLQTGQGHQCNEVSAHTGLLLTTTVEVRNTIYNISGPNHNA